MLMRLSGRGCPKWPSDILLLTLTSEETADEVMELESLLKERRDLLEKRRALFGEYARCNRDAVMRASELHDARKRRTTEILDRVVRRNMRPS